MNVFTDDDLANWKEIAKRSFEWEPVPIDQINALIGRLEAAEALIGIPDHNNIVYRPLFVAWRAAAGKS